MKTFLEFIVEGAAVPERQQFIDSLNKSSLSSEQITAAIKKWDADPANWTTPGIDPEKLKRDAEIETNIRNGPQIRATPKQSIDQQYIQASRDLSTRDPVAAQIGLGHVGGPQGTPTVGAQHGLAVAGAIEGGGLAAPVVSSALRSAATAVPRFIAHTGVNMALSSGLQKATETGLNMISPEPSKWKDVTSSAVSMIPWGSDVRGQAFKSALTMMGLGAGGKMLQQNADRAGTRAAELVPSQSSEFMSQKDAADIQKKKEQAAYDTVAGTMYNYGHYLPMVGPKAAAIPASIETAKGLYDYLTADTVSPDSTKSNKK